MQELQLVSVDAEKSTLVLSDGHGAQYTLALNDDVRAAMKTHPTSLVRKVGEGQTPSPREIQARIRAGATAEEVAQETGAPLSMVQRFEGPVIAEREYVASRAQAVIVAEPDGLLDGYREAFGTAAANLGEMVLHRLEAFGAETDSASWDTFKRDDGTWNVVLAFELGKESPNTIGEPPLARWVFKPSSSTLTNANRWAQVLSEMEPIDGPLPSRRLVAVPSGVFDVETSEVDPHEFSGVGTDDSAGSPESESEGEDGERTELLDMLMERRGQRLGTDEISDDALAAMIAKGPVPGARGNRADDVGAEGASEGNELEGQQQLFGGLRLAPEPTEDSSITLQGNIDPDTTSVQVQHQSAPDARKDAEEATKENVKDNSKDASAKDDQSADTGRIKRALKNKRSSVPSWDEIVFGAKND